MRAWSGVGTRGVSRDSSCWLGVSEVGAVLSCFSCLVSVSLCTHSHTRRLIPPTPSLPPFLPPLQTPSPRTARGLWNWSTTCGRHTPPRRRRRRQPQLQPPQLPPRPHLLPRPCSPPLACEARRRKQRERRRWRMMGTLLSLPPHPLQQASRLPPQRAVAAAPRGQQRQQPQQRPPHLHPGGRCLLPRLLQQQ